MIENHRGEKKSTENLPDKKKGAESEGGTHTHTHTQHIHTNIHKHIHRKIKGEFTTSILKSNTKNDQQISNRRYAYSSKYLSAVK